MNFPSFFRIRSVTRLASERSKCELPEREARQISMSSHQVHDKREQDEPLRGVTRPRGEQRYSFCNLDETVPSGRTAGVCSGNADRVRPRAEVQIGSMEVQQGAEGAGRTRAKGPGAKPRTGGRSGGRARPGPETEEAPGLLRTPLCQTRAGPRPIRCPGRASRRRP